MYSLIITANPGEWSTTNIIAKIYSDQKKLLWHKTEIIDLYNTNLNLDFLNFNTEINQKNVSIWQSKIIEADELVLIFPMWWWDSPAILKNRFDNIFSTWFAFYYKNNKPIWLLNKKAKIFMTSDWPSMFFTIFPISVKYFWKYMRLWFCWIKLTDFVLFDLMRKRKKTIGREKNIIKKVKKIAEK